MSSTDHRYFSQADIDASVAAVTVPLDGNLDCSGDRLARVWVKTTHPINVKVRSAPRERADLTADVQYLSVSPGYPQTVVVDQPELISLVAEISSPTTTPVRVTWGVAGWRAAE